jgi:hypothetical protein
MYRPVKKKVQGWTNAGLAVVALLGAFGLGRLAFGPSATHSSSVAFKSASSSAAAPSTTSSAKPSTATTPSFHVVGSSYHDDSSSRSSEGD